MNIAKTDSDLTLHSNDIVCWWSGGITSAVACKIAIGIYGIERCRIVMIDTHNEDIDTYRFKEDCEEWYGKSIDVISAIGVKYDSIEDVWYDFESLNVAHGAICSSELKRQVRLDWQKKNVFTHQVFGFDGDEPNRAKNLKKNYANSNPIFPLLMFWHSKKDCIRIVENAGIRIPQAYEWGYPNNNCLGTGCVQGGIGYWQKYRLQFPDRAKRMAEREHELTRLKGSPVTILKDQSLLAKESGRTLVFLEKHPDYPELKCLDDFKIMKVESMVECNGFCGMNGGLFEEKEEYGGLFKNVKIEL